MVETHGGGAVLPHAHVCAQGGHGLHGDGEQELLATRREVGLHHHDEVVQGDVAAVVLASVVADIEVGLADRGGTRRLGGLDAGAHALGGAILPVSVRRGVDLLLRGEGVRAALRGDHPVHPVDVPGGVVGEVVVTRIGELPVGEGLVEEVVRLVAQSVARVHGLHEVAELVGGVGVVGVLQADLHRLRGERAAEQVRAVNDAVNARDPHARAHPVGELDAAAARHVLVRPSRGRSGVRDAERATHRRAERPGERPGAAGGKVVVDGGERERVTCRDQAVLCGERHACGDKPARARAKEVERHALLARGCRGRVCLGRAPEVVAQVLAGGRPRARQLVGRLLERGLQQVGRRLARVEANGVEAELASGAAPGIAHAARLVAHGEQRGEERVGAVAGLPAPGEGPEKPGAVPLVGGRVEEARARHGRRLDPHGNEDRLARPGALVPGRADELVRGDVHGPLQVGSAAERGVLGARAAHRGGDDLKRPGGAARPRGEAHVVSLCVGLVDVKRHEGDDVGAVSDHADARRDGRPVVLPHEARDGGVERVGEVGLLGPPAVGQVGEDAVRAHDEDDVMGGTALLANGDG